jgi:hypothetical protein
MQFITGQKHGNKFKLKIMSKYYFREDDDERCYLRKQIIEDMKEEGIAGLKIIEAKRVTGESYFYCTVNQDIGEVGQGCGKFCSQYKPRNGKNGRCRYSGYYYEPTEKSKILIIKQNGI